MIDPHSWITISRATEDPRYPLPSSGCMRSSAMTCRSRITFLCSQTMIDLCRLCCGGFGWPVSHPTDYRVSWLAPWGVVKASVLGFWLIIFDHRPSPTTRCELELCLDPPLSLPCGGRWGLETSVTQYHICKCVCSEVDVCVCVCVCVCAVSYTHLRAHET